MIEKLSEELSKESFCRLVFDYINQEQWKYQGDRPAVIEFYAPWCGPCRAMALSFEEFGKQTSGVIKAFKVNTEVETELAEVMGVQTLPTLLFIPVQGQPKVIHGQMNVDQLMKAAHEIFQIALI